VGILIAGKRRPAGIVAVGREAGVLGGAVLVVVGKGPGPWVVVGENYGTLEILGVEWEFAAYGLGLRWWKRLLHFFLWEIMGF
jgi:hypothetical protein